jgi:hypothetical protein
MDEVQIDVNDLMTAFAQENAALAQRAIIAEQKAKAYKNALDRAHVVINTQREQALAGMSDAPDPVAELTVVDPAVASVGTAAPKRRARPARAKD